MVSADSLYTSTESFTMSSRLNITASEFRHIAGWIWPLVTSAVAGQQLNGTMSTGNALDMAHRGRLESTPTVPQQ